MEQEVSRILRYTCERIKYFRRINNITRYKEQILIATDSGVLLFSGDQFTPIPSKKYFNSAIINTITLDSEDNIWIGSEKRGLFKIINGDFSHPAQAMSPLLHRHYMQLTIQSCFPSSSRMYTTRT